MGHKDDNLRHMASSPWQRVTFLEVDVWWAS